MRCHLCFFLLFLELLISHFLLLLSLCLLLYFSNALIELVNAVTSFSQMLKHTVHPIGSTVSLGNLSAAALSSHSTLAGLSSRLDAQLMSQDLSSPTLCVGCSSSVLPSYVSFCLTPPPFFLPGNFKIFIPGLSLFYSLCLEHCGPFCIISLMAPLLCFPLFSLNGTCLISGWISRTNSLIFLLISYFLFLCLFFNFGRFPWLRSYSKFYWVFFFLLSYLFKNFQ